MVASRLEPFGVSTTSEKPGGGCGFLEGGGGGAKVVFLSDPCDGVLVRDTVSIVDGAAAGTVVVVFLGGRGGGILLTGSDWTLGNLCSQNNARKTELHLYKS